MSTSSIGRGQIIVLDDFGNRRRRCCSCSWNSVTKEQFLSSSCISPSSLLVFRSIAFMWCFASICVLPIFSWKLDDNKPFVVIEEVIYILVVLMAFYFLGHLVTVSNNWELFGRIRDRKPDVFSSMTVNNPSLPSLSSSAGLSLSLGLGLRPGTSVGGLSSLSSLSAGLNAEEGGYEESYSSLLVSDMPLYSRKVHHSLRFVWILYEFLLPGSMLALIPWVLEDDSFTHPSSTSNICKLHLHLFSVFFMLGEMLFSRMPMITAHLLIDLFIVILFLAYTVALHAIHHVWFYDFFDPDTTRGFALYGITLVVMVGLFFFCKLLIGIRSRVSSNCCAPSQSSLLSSSSSSSLSSASSSASSSGLSSGPAISSSLLDYTDQDPYFSVTLSSSSSSSFARSNTNATDHQTRIANANTGRKSQFGHPPALLSTSTILPSGRSSNNIMIPRSGSFVLANQRPSSANLNPAI
eukprot:TRINITY_DN1764_c0_g1_i1.p1 TRINITY_DN1764_c0_g1~~TRINITY_DN1764_c0_g1_i1.p1  ORF type:complete len:465 (-),score=93.71 TRINITY_DN1764_c0_g1_i1:163-1557(-)